jgi:hypothetical protein
MPVSRPQPHLTLAPLLSVPSLFVVGAQVRLFCYLEDKDLFHESYRRMLSKVRKRHFLRHLYIKCIILPRQARDKHRENSKKARFRRLLSRRDSNEDLGAESDDAIFHFPRSCPEPILANRRYFLI